MKLRDIVVEKAILPQLKATNRDDAVSELLDGLVLAGAIRPELVEEFRAAIIKREKRGSTGVGHGVAIPHVKSDRVAKLVVAVGVSHAGVEFAALDKQPVHI